MLKHSNFNIKTVNFNKLTISLLKLWSNWWSADSVSPLHENF